MATLAITFTGSDETRAALGSVTGGLKDVDQAAKDAGSSGSGFFSGLLQTAGGFLAANVIGGITSQFSSFISGAIGDAREANALMGQTENVIKSTGNAAGVTAQHIADVASSLSAAAGKSLFGDNQVQQAENLFLTFTNIKGKVLDAATAISVDMAQALGGEPKAQAIQLGKALNDPIAGISALSRVGVTFDDQQKKLIKTYMEHGEVAKAQGVILTELNKEFGGSAAAAAKADGGWAQLKDRLGELGESVGQAVLPLLGKVVGFLNDDIMPALEHNLVPAVETVIGVFGKVASTLSPFGAQLHIIQVAVSALAGDIFNGDLSGIGEWFRDWLDIDASPFLSTIQDVSAALSALAGDIFNGDLSGIGEWFRDWLDIDISPFIDGLGGIQDVFRGLIATFTDASNPVEGLLNVLSEISPTFELVRGAVEAALPPIQQIVTDVFGIITGFISEHGATIVADVTGVWQQVQSIVNAVLPPIQSIISSVFSIIAVFIHNHGDDIKAFLGQTWDQIAQIVSTALELIKAVVVPVLTFIATFISGHSTQIQAVLTDAWNIIKAVIDAALTLIKGVITAALQAIHGDWEGAWNTIKEMFARVWDDIKVVLSSALDTAKQVLSMAWDAIKGKVEDAWGSIKDAISGFVDDIVHAFEALPGELETIGTNIIQGLLQGIQDSWQDVLNWFAEHLGSGLIDWAKHQLGISSPSQLFADAIGSPLVMGILQGMEDTLPSLYSLVDDMGKSLEGQVKAIAQKVSETIADGFDAEGSIDRLMAKNLDAVAKLDTQFQAETQAKLDAAAAAAAKIADPVEAAKYYKQQSQQILELADLGDKREKARQAGDMAAVARYDQQIALIQKAQAAEDKAAQERAAHQPTQAQQISDMIAKLLATPGVIDSGNPAIAQLIALANQLSGGKGPQFIPPPPPMGAGPDGQGFRGPARQQEQQGQIKISVDDRGMGWLQNLVKVEVDGVLRTHGLRTDRNIRTGR